MADRIGIIDSDAEVRVSLAALLECGWFSSVTFFDGWGFLLEPNAADYRCILVDVFAPKMYGFTILEQIAQRELVTKIIFMCRNLSSVIFSWARSVGVLDIVEKPVDEAKLSDAISRALG